MNTIIEAIALSLLLSGSAIAEALLPVAFQAEWGGNIDKSKFVEPSGICWHEGRGTLFVVGDEGHIGEMTVDGELKQRVNRGPMDLEGITSDPSTGKLYAAVEGADAIIEIDPDRLEIARTFELPRTWNGAQVMKEGGQGIESITFVPDPAHPEGGTFYVGNQVFALGDDTDQSAIIEFSVPIRSGKGEATLLRTIRPGMIDLAGLHYDRTTDRIYVISDGANICAVLDRRSGKVLESYAFPGKDQEGFTLDGRGHAFFVQDSGGIIKLTLTDR